VRRMFTSRARRAVTVLALIVGSGAGLPAAMPAAHGQGNPPPTAAPVALEQTDVQPACDAPQPGHLRCLVVHRKGRGGSPSQSSPAASQPAGYGPQDLWSAYDLPAYRGASRTVAVVTAYDNPNAETDLGVYRQQYSLPACTTADGCFGKVNQRGESAPLPPAHLGWAVESAVDTQLASAVCPRCRLLLVEADDDSYTSLGAAVDTAVRLGADVVSNSYGSDESNLMLDYAEHYDHPGALIVASSGNTGFGAPSFPAVLDTVTAVGGTTLFRTSGPRGWTETAWAWSGSGCSAYIDKPDWQRDPNCSMRTTADASAVADPDTGVAVYDSFLPAEFAGWQVVGGTSVAAPIIAGVYALAGAHPRDGASGLYRLPNDGHLNDIVGGSTGFCGEDYLCTAVPGYDGPTGLGTPRGVLAFR
jgi:subtilase family serine protease